MENVLVLCTGNSCRSVMAEALINQLGAGQYKAVSAGSKPTGFVHPKSIETLKRHGIEAGEPRSQSWDDFEGQDFDLVITVCDAAAAEPCPVFLGTHKKLHWPAPDPAAATGSEAEIDAVFDEAFAMLKERVEKFIRANIAKENLSDLIRQTKAMLNKHTSFKRDDLTGRMITYYIFKQIDHAMSVMKLDPSMDATLIARTMIEGVINLTWALEKPDERVKDWFDYSAVYDFKLLEQKEIAESLVSEDDKDAVIKNFETNAAVFLKKNGRQYHDNFRKGENLGNISKNNDDLKYFYQNYKYFSDWVHWGSQSLRHAIEEKHDEISYYEDKHVYRIPALIVAFVSLIDIAIKTNEHFSLGQEERFEKVSSKMIKDLESKNND